MTTCQGCGRQLGLKGDKPMVRLRYRPDKVHAHKDPICLSAALRKWLKEKGEQ